jgi:hypothetical protein
MAFLIDTGWMQAIIGIVAIFITILLYLKTRKRKSLTYEVVSEYPLISVDDEIKGKLQILFNGEAIENVHLLSIKFINDGNIPISAGDYERPLTINFEGESNLLSAEFVKGNPVNLIASLKVQNKIIELEPVLMNGSDFFLVKVLIGQYSGKFNIDTRIIGVKFIRRRQPQTEWSLIKRNSALISVVATLFGAFSIYSFYLARRSEMGSDEQQHRILIERELLRLNEPPQVVVIPLSPSITRRGEIPVIKSPESAQIVRLQLSLPENNYQSYSAEIQTEDGKPLFTINELSNKLTQDSTKLVFLDLPARLLQVGDYQIKLYGKTSDGRILLAAFYFRIRDA